MFGMEDQKFEQIQHKEDVNEIKALISTSEGDIELELYHDKAPVAVWNFVNLAEGRQPNMKEGRYYDGLIFHRVIKNFMIQAGCPSGLGTGGPGYEFDNELSTELDHGQEGILAMANRGKDTNGSQFYITLAATPHLDGGYTIFGKVISGMDTVRKIGDVAVDPYNHKPNEDIVITTVEIIRS